MIQELEQLKNLVFSGGYGEEDYKQISALENELIEIAQAEKIAENPSIRRFIDYLETEAKRVTFLLSNDRSLSEVQRMVLFEKRDICDHFTQLFTGQKKESIEQTIKDLLNVAKAQS